MIEYLEDIDRQIVVFINGCHTPFFDELMWWISARITWIPLYLILLFLAFKKLSKEQLILFVLFAVLAVIITDLISVHLFKNVFLRYRPSHNLLITEQLHYYQIKPGEWYKGGDFGFVSSHAANYFAIATASFLVLRNQYKNLKWYLLAIGILICYSRIYLGVHYLSDLIAGALLGSLISGLLYKFWYLSITLQKKKV